MEQVCTASHVSADTSISLVELHGEIDLDTVELLRDCLAAGVEQDTDVVVDLTDVTLIDCASLAALVQAHRLADRRGHRVCLVAPCASVRRTLAAAMLDSTFPLYPDRGGAMADPTAGPSRQR